MSVCKAAATSRKARPVTACKCGAHVSLSEVEHREAELLGLVGEVKLELARTLAEDVRVPRGAACITYSQECAREDDLEGARQREPQFKNGRTRRSRWLSREWRTSAAGNDFLHTQDGFNVVVYRRGDDLGRAGRASRIRRPQNADTSTTPTIASAAPSRRGQLAGWRGKPISP